MQIHGQDFLQSSLDRIQQLVNSDSGLSRRKLATQVCEWLDWRSPSGKLKEMSCRKALSTLGKKGLLTFENTKKAFAFSNKVTPSTDVKIPEISCKLSQLGNINVIPIQSRYSKDSKIWRFLLDTYHYLGSGSLCGAQLRYLIKSENHGVLGALAFDSASFALKERDKDIQWSEAARHANLSQVVRNARFLILPTVKVPNLASHVLSITLARLPQDWKSKYAIEPVLVETFVDPTNFQGTCYQAANWRYIGDTAGRRDGIAKKIYLFPLSDQWKQKLCKEPEIKLGDAQPVESPSNWAEKEFGRVHFYDNRLKERLYTIAQNFYQKPQANIPEASGSHSGSVASYRFFKNNKTNMDIILKAHTEETITRIKEHKIVLVPQDTSTLDYSSHPQTQGMGPTNNIAHKTTGLILHDTLAFTEEGTPLGVLDAQCWARDPNEKGKAKKRKELPIEQKESMKWLRSFRKVTEVQKLAPDTKMVLMGDRESDIFELFLDHIKTENGPELLVRSEKSRNRKVGEEYLWDFMQQLDFNGSLKIHIPHSGNRKSRDTILDISFSEVELTPPKKLRPTCDPIKVWAVYALESDPDPEISEPIKWMLLTTVPVKNLCDAKRSMKWYSKRWGIEVYHRVLKSGCRIKDRQLGDVDRIKTCLGIDMVVAWRIFHLTMLGRETPGTPCTAYFEDIEWKALCCYANKNPIPPPDPPSLLVAIYMVARIGGFLNRKQDGFPGTETLWRGLQRLDTAVEVFAIFYNSE
jgi:hypothetical protein